MIAGTCRNAPAQRLWGAEPALPIASTSFKQTYQELKSVKAELAEFETAQAKIVLKIEAAQKTLAEALEELIALRQAERARKAHEKAAEEIAEERTETIFEAGLVAPPGYAEPMPRHKGELMSRVKHKWESFSREFRHLVEDQNNLSWDGRAIGQLAYQFTDRRRTKPISADLADMIAELHGEYRSFVLRQSSDW